ncbi:MAG TPA: oxidoreductase, partial [Rhodobiaceae bacterium]|nr:oxidoreductase [Rhodobiaceae bacterium]
MTGTFRAIRASKGEKAPQVEFANLTEADLMEGDVTVAVDYSTVNYKDGLALTGAAPIIRAWPLIPGIDFSGKVEKSDNPKFKPGDRVVLNGYGVGEGHSGGYAQKARVKGDWLVKLPDAISNEQAMAIGTAGYTSMLCVLALEKNGVKPGSDVV